MVNATASKTLPRAAVVIGAMVVVTVAALYSMSGAGLLTGSNSTSGQDSSSVGNTASTEGRIANLHALAEDRAGDTSVQLRLAEAYLQRGRETEESSYHVMAQQRLSAALERSPDDPALLTAMGRVALGMHEFEDAKGWGTRALALDETDADAHAVVADAQIELGEYESAVQHVQAMLDIDPDVNASTRTAYLRELHGDTEGALAAHERALDITRPVGEPAASVRATLGDLYFQIGRPDDAKRMYEDALRVFPEHLGSREGLAQVLLLEGDATGALKEYEKLIAVRPDVGHLAGAGDILAGLGDDAGAERYYERAHAFIQNVDGLDRFLYTREIVMFYADRGLNTGEAVRLAREELDIRRDIYGYDALAWALYNYGAYQEAAAVAKQSLRLGTRDPSLFYHAGLIEAALGNEATAIPHFEQAIQINPLFQAPASHPSPDQLIAELSR